MIAQIEIQQLPVIAEILDYDAKRALLRMIEREAARNAEFSAAVTSALEKLDAEQAVIDEWLERQEAALFPLDCLKKESEPDYWLTQTQATKLAG